MGLLIIKAFCAVFAVVGAGVLFFAFTMFNDTRSFVARSVPTDGTIVDFVEVITQDDEGRDVSTYAPRFEFIDGNGEVQRVTSPQSSSFNSEEIGDTIPILYDPENPTDANIDSFGNLWLGSVLLSVFGLIFFIVGAGMFYLVSRRQGMIKELQARGVRIIATVTSVRESINLSNDHHHSDGWVVNAEWVQPTTGETFEFQSDYLRTDPSFLLADKTIPVLIDDDNPKRYVVEIDHLK